LNSDIIYISHNGLLNAAVNQMMSILNIEIFSKPTHLHIRGKRR